MKTSCVKTFASPNHCFLGALAVLGLSVMPVLAGPSIITGFSPVFNINPIAGPGGESVSLNTQISYGNFFGLGNEYLYQYQVTVNAASPAINGFNLWTVSQAVFNAGGNVAGNAITAATAAPANNLIAVAPGGVADLGGAGPGGSAVPGTPGGVANFNNLGAFVPAFSYGGNGGFYVFTTPPGNLNQNINLDTTVADPNNPPGAIAGLNWGFTYWADGAGDSVIRWYALGGAGGGNTLAAGKTMTFDAFSPFGPVSAGAFPDPQGPESVDVGFDDNNGDSSLPALDTVDSVPEPSTWGLLATSLLGGGLMLRRKFVNV